MTDDPTPLLSDDDIATLNAARTVLKDAQKRTAHDWSGGCVYTELETAEHAVFMVLNRISSHNLVLMTQAQIHNYAPDEVTA